MMITYYTTGEMIGRFYAFLGFDMQKFRANYFTLYALPILGYCRALWLTIHVKVPAIMAHF